MCCVFLLLAFVGPRTALVALWLTGYLYGVFQTPLWPILGFIFMPFTTIAYAVAMHNGGVHDIWLIVMIVAVIFDLGVHGGSEGARRRRYA